MSLPSFKAAGWVAAASLAGLFALTGFQDNSAKFGVVDISKAIESSELGKSNNATFQQMVTSRNGVLEFIATYRVLSIQQVQRLRELSLKTTVTDPEKTELDRLKADIIAADKKFKDLTQVAKPTAEQTAQLEEFNRQVQTMSQTYERYQAEFQQEVDGWAQKTRQTSIERARGILTNLAKSQGYTMVFSAEAAPYAANDITDAVTKALNTK